MRTSRMGFALVVLAGCNSLLGIPSGGDIVGPPNDGAPGDVSTVGNCQDTPADCRLAGIDRAIGKEGEAIILEGTFGDTVEVEFPGVTAPQPAMLLGARRARVEIPAGAFGGPLVVKTAGRMFAGVQFRSTSFELGINHFQLDYTQANEARAAPLLTTERGGAASLVIGDRIVVIGGQASNGTKLNTTDVAQINRDGTLSAFSVGAAVMAATRADHTATRIGSRVFVIGGRNDIFLDTSEVATLAEGGVVGSFASGPSLTVARAGHNAVVIGDGLYVIGGASGDKADALKTVERAQINSDGTLGDFVIVEGVSLLRGRIGATAVVAGDQLYVMGGTEGASSLPQDTIERAKINGDGTLQPFEAVSIRLKRPRFNASAIVLGDTVVVIGGLNGSGVDNSVELASIVADNALGDFAVLPQRLAVGRIGATLAVAGNYLYIMGGYNPGAAKTIDHTSLIGVGDLDPFANLPGSLTIESRSFFTFSSIGDAFVAVGGILVTGGTAFRQVTLLQSRADGAPGAVVAENAALLNPRAKHRTAVAGGFLHILGGIDGPNALTQSQSISTATFGAITAGRSLVNFHNAATAVALGNRLYVIGGEIGITSIESTLFDADGGLQGGTFTQETNNLSLGRGSHCSAVIGTSVYAIGGAASPNTRTVERAQITSGQLGDFALVPGVQLVEPTRTTVSCAVLGRYLYVFGGENTSGVRGVSVERAEIDPATFDLSTFETVTAIVLRTERFDHRVLELENGIFAIGGHSLSSTSPTNSMERATIR